MCEEGTPKSSRRSARLSSGASPDPKPPATAPPNASKLQPLSVDDLMLHGEPLSLDGLIASFPARRSQILELISLLGPLDSPMMPLFVYGGASTGKTSVVLQIFRHLNRPFIYCSLITCYSPRILFESVLNQLLLHRACESSRYASAKRCERPSDFVNLLREALGNLVNTLKGNVKSESTKSKTSRVNGNMIYLIFDHVEVAREWDMSSSVVPLLLNLHQILNMTEVGLIFISRASLDTFHSDTGFAEPFQVYFPAYNEEELRSIFMKDRAKSKLYNAFLDLVLPPFYRITRRVDELSVVFTPLFKKYCEPLDDVGTALSEEVKRKLFSHLQPYITMYMQTTFFSSEHLPNDTSAMKNEIVKKKKIAAKKEASEEIGFHMSTSARYLLISAFLASRNPATLDASLFDSTGGLDNRKRKRKVSEKSMEKKETKEQELLMKGPGTFPLERLLAIYQCLTSVIDYASDYENADSMDAEVCNNVLLPNIHLQLSSLCSANFISKGGSCPLEGSTRYRSTISEDMALKVARSLDFPLFKYMYRS